MTGSARMVTSAERLRRLLALVPYVASRKVVSLAETAQTFGMTERELIDDLNLAWCVELKDPDPYCPIDLSYEGGEIVISQAESIERPLRLAADEASALLVALRTLQEASSGSSGERGQGSGVGEPPSPVESVILKLEDAAAGVAVDRSQVAVVPPADEHGWASGCGRPWPTAGASTCGTTCPAGTRRQTGTWTRCGCSSLRAGPTWRAGAAGPRASGSSASTGCWT